MTLTISTNSIDWIEIISIALNLLTSIIAIVISVKTLKQSSNAIIESSRANINFYVETLTGGQYFIVIKNFGNSPGKLLSLDVTPELDYSKSPMIPSSHPVLTDYKDIFLAPGQMIKSWFPFGKYPDKVFDVKISYKTLGKVYTETYTIDLNYTKGIEYIRKSSIDYNDTKDALAQIANTLTGISEKL